MIEILYQDEHLVVVNKPAGLLVHRSMLASDEQVFALQLVRDAIGQHVYPVHRLDKPTSGVLLFAKSGEIARLMQQQFTDNLVNKLYLAVARGYVPECGCIDYALKYQLDAIADKGRKPQSEAQSAVTLFERLATTEVAIPVGRYPQSRFSLVLMKPLTGRKHQLRRHLKHISHHLLGDTTHGDGKQNKNAREQLNFRRMALHASVLEVKHPISGDELRFIATLDNDFNQLLARLDWQVPTQCQIDEQRCRKNMMS